jgi:hypothetical protein
MIKHLQLLCLCCVLILLSACHKTAPVAPVVYHLDGDVVKLYGNNTTGVNIVVVGDCFTHDDLQKDGRYDTDVKQLIDYLFTVAPFKQNKQNFNVYMVYAQSPFPGAIHDGFNQGRTASKFNSYFDLQISRLLLLGDYPTFLTYVGKALPLDKVSLKVCLVNDVTYGGSGGDVAVVSTNSLSKRIMVHEIGHTFGGLADEYQDSSIGGEYSPGLSASYPNVDSTGDLNKIKWSSFVKLPAYKDVVGAYEGALYLATDYYRPEQRSVMYDLNTLSYNAPSREAIVRRMDEIMNIPFDFDAFVKDDASSVQPVFAVEKTNLTFPKHDFIRMKDRVMELPKSKK